MIKLSDFVARTLADLGLRQVFMVTGGGAMHLNVSFAREPRLCCIYNHHEQASAMAAEGYARVTNRPAIVNVTTGPGGINALNGVYGAWTDSIPMLVVSGQVKRETCMQSYAPTNLRQLGDQEVDIIRMVKGITKYAALVEDPRTIGSHLHEAVRLATTGRPGPCWLDIPVDVQSNLVDETSPIASEAESAVTGAADLAGPCREVLERVKRAARPVILVGAGVRLAGATEVFERVVRRLNIPVTTAWTHDIIASDDPLYCGRPGTIGNRAGNFTVQNADLLLVLGSRLNIRQVGYSWQTFARDAFKIQVDIDANELAKPTVRPDLPVEADVRLFLEELERQLDEDAYEPNKHQAWLDWCRARVKRYPVVLPRHRQFNGRINPYHFMEVLFEHLADDDVVVCGNASACIVPFQAANLRKGQRLFSNSGSASMGYDLPAAIGAAAAREGRRVICLAGDGSIQMNVQELQTIIHNKLPVKVFVLNNEGYLSIRSTQRSFFGAQYGEGPQSGVSFPDMVRVAWAYGIPARRICCADFSPEVAAVLEAPGPTLADVILDPEQTFEPRISSTSLPDGRIVSQPLENMYPFLSPEELADNLLIPRGSL